MDNLLIAVVVAIVTSLIVRAARRPAVLDEDEGKPVLRYVESVRWIGWGGVFLAVGVMVLAVVQKPETRGDWSAVVGMVIGFTGLGGVLVNESRAQIRLTHYGLQALSPWRGEIEIAWSEVRRVTYSKLLRWLVIRSESGDVIRAHDYLVGLPTLFEYFHQELKPGLFAEAEQDYLRTV